MLEKVDPVQLVVLKSSIIIAGVSREDICFEDKRRRKALIVNYGDT